jgi:eukaryotic-like serine/threonine-protein kinase
LNDRAQGQTLERVIAAHGGFGLPVARARRIMGHIAHAIAALNDSGVIRGVLPPASILITHEGGHEIADLADDSTDAPPHLGYFAPERSRLTQAPLSWSSDVFPLAAVLFEVLCGTRAFPQTSAAEIARHMMLGPAPSLARTAATLPVELRDRPDLVTLLDAHFARALSGDPTSRHPTVMQWWTDVDPILKEVVRPAASGERPVEQPAPFPARQSRPGTALGFAPPAPAQAFGAGIQDKPAPSTSLPMASDPMLDARVSWENLGPPIGVETLHASLLVEEGRAILAAGSRGLYRLVHGAWSRVPGPAGVDVCAVRGLSRLPSGDLLLFGEPDFCAALSARGAAQRINLPDRDIAVEAVCADEHGLVLVGARVSRPVAAAMLLPRGAPPSTLTIENTSRLTGVTRLSDGTLVAVGIDGVIVELTDKGSRNVPWARSGHLYDVTTGIFGAAHAVGSGGHAVRIEPSPTGGPPVVTLERVQTTRDLYGVSADLRSGAIWAVGADARLLQRREDGWVRVPLDASTSGRLLSVHLRSSRVVVVIEDGSAFACEVGT